MPSYFLNFFLGLFKYLSHSQPVILPKQTLKNNFCYINLLRSYYKNKSFEEIFIDGFANAQCRLDKEKLLII